MSLKKETLYTSYGAWAIHFSIVRLTIATFMVTTCLGLLNFGTPSTTGKLIITCIGILSAFVFTWATSRECEFVQKQQELAEQSMSTKEFYKADLPIWAVYIFVSCLMFYTFIFWQPRAQIDSSLPDIQQSQEAIPGRIEKSPSLRSKFAVRLRNLA